MSQPRLLLFHNTPKAKRYYRTLAAGLDDFDVYLRPTSIRFDRARLDEHDVEPIANYSILRKRFRPHLKGWRLRANEYLYRQAARWHYAYARAQIEALQPDLIGVWSGNAVDVSACRAAAADCGLRSVLFEIGLLPGTTTCDIAGVNFDSSVPRDPAFYANFSSSGAAPLPRQLVPRKPRMGRRQTPPLALPQRYLFVPFQVALDSQILLHSPWIKSMPELFETAIKAVGDYNRGLRENRRMELVFKRHPSCPRDYARLREDARHLQGVHFADSNCTEDLIRNCAGVITINSSIGIEAMLFEKPVLTLGNAVYSIPGVTDQAVSDLGVARWVEAVASTQSAESAGSRWPHRQAFLNYLATEYCIPGTHRAPTPEHLARIGSRIGAWLGETRSAVRGRDRSPSPFGGLDGRIA